MEWSKWEIIRVISFELPTYFPIGFQIKNCLVDGIEITLNQASSVVCKAHICFNFESFPWIMAAAYFYPALWFVLKIFSPWPDCQIGILIKMWMVSWEAFLSTSFFEVNLILLSFISHWPPKMSVDAQYGLLTLTSKKAIWWQFLFYFSRKIFVKSLVALGSSSTAAF